MNFGTYAVMVIVNTVQMYALTKDKKDANILRKVLTMAEYIDRKQIIYTWWRKPDGTFSDGVTFLSVINALPVADVVEVVRCKDCIHGEYDKMIDEYYCEMTYCSEKKNHFCGYGERKVDSGSSS